MPKPPTLCPHGVLGKSKCSECLAEKERKRRQAGKVKDKRDRKEYMREYMRTYMRKYYLKRKEQNEQP